MSSKNPEVRARNSRRHYDQNKEKIKARSAGRRKVDVLRNKEYVKAHLLKHPCVDCGNHNLMCLDFDHVRGVKFRGVCQLVLRAVSLETLQKEIDKCEIRCSNCHRIRTRLDYLSKRSLKFK